MNDDLLVWDEKRGEWTIPVTDLVDALEVLTEIQERMAEDRGARDCLLTMGGISAIQNVIDSVRDVWVRRAKKRAEEQALEKAVMPTSKRGSA